MKCLFKHRSSESCGIGYILTAIALSTLSNFKCPHQQYPLSDLVKNESNDDRQKGVAVIVSINKLRNDAWKLPEDILDKAELQVSYPFRTLLDSCETSPLLAVGAFAVSRLSQYHKSKVMVKAMPQGHAFSAFFSYFIVKIERWSINWKW